MKKVETVVSGLLILLGLVLIVVVVSLDRAF